MEYIKLINLDPETCGKEIMEKRELLWAIENTCDYKEIIKERKAARSKLEFEKKLTYLV